MKYPSLLHPHLRTQKINQSKLIKNEKANPNISYYQPVFNIKR